MARNGHAPAPSASVRSKRTSTPQILLQADDSLEPASSATSISSGPRRLSCAASQTSAAAQTDASPTCHEDRRRGQGRCVLVGNRESESLPRSSGDMWKNSKPVRHVVDQSLVITTAL